MSIEDFLKTIEDRLPYKVHAKTETIYLVGLQEKERDALLALIRLYKSEADAYLQEVPYEREETDKKELAILKRMQS